MALKKVIKKSNSDSELRRNLIGELRSIEKEIYSLQDMQVVLQKELLEVDLKPFKIGGYALANIPSGRTMKEQKCLLECESGILYLRPIKENGELSGRHFSLTPVGDKTYADYLKEVK